MGGETEAQRLAEMGKHSNIRVMAGGGNNSQKPSKRRQLVTCTDRKERSDSVERSEGSGREACREHPTPPPRHAATKNRHWAGHCRLSRRNAVLQAPGKDGTETPCPAPRPPAWHHCRAHAGPGSSPTCKRGKKTKHNQKTNHPIKGFNSTDHTRYLTPSNCN